METATWIICVFPNNVFGFRYIPIMSAASMTVHTAPQPLESLH